VGLSLGYAPSVRFMCIAVSLYCVGNASAIYITRFTLTHLAGFYESDPYMAGVVVGNALSMLGWVSAAYAALFVFAFAGIMVFRSTFSSPAEVATTNGRIVVGVVDFLLIMGPIIGLLDALHDYTIVFTSTPILGGHLQLFEVATLLSATLAAGLNIFRHRKAVLTDVLRS
jgi:hypothetical protein